MFLIALLLVFLFWPVLYVGGLWLAVPGPRDRL